MNDLDLIKRIAEINNLQCVHEMDISNIEMDHYIGCDDGTPYYYHNPLTDKALNCELRDKYEVAIDYVEHCVIIHPSYAYDIRAVVGFNSKEGIPRAVLLCIIEAKAND